MEMKVHGENEIETDVDLWKGMITLTSRWEGKS